MAKRYYFTKWQGVLDECLFTFLCSSLAMVRWAGTWSLLAFRASLYHLSASSICPTFMYTSPAKKINECRLSELPDFIYLYVTGTVANIHIHIYIPSLKKLLQEKNAVILQIYFKKLIVFLHDLCFYFKFHLIWKLLHLNILIRIA